MKKTKLDPITYEVVSHKIWQTLWEGRATMELVSGSVVVTEAKEVLYGFYDAEGNSIASSAGLMVHIIGGEQMIKNLIEWYTENPGIYEGDVFFFNDPYVGGMHVPDQACIAPLFYKGKLTAWLISLFHTSEVGAIETGSGTPPSATEIYHEGVRMPGLKLVEKGVERKDHYMILQRLVRDPEGITLDCKARVASLNVGKKRMIELIDRYGLEMMQTIWKQMVIDSENRAKEKLLELPDGTWRAATYQDHDGKKYSPYRLAVAMIKKGDHLTFDFSDCSISLPGPTNLTIHGLYGMVFTAICTRLFYEEQWNRGPMNCVDIIAQKGSCVYPNPPTAVGLGIVIGAGIVNLLHVVISKMLVCSEKYYDDQNASWNTNLLYLGWGGPNQQGITMGTLLFDFLAAGQGAGATFDGVDNGAFIYTPEVIAGDVEMYEAIMPFVYLARRQAPGSGGPGKYRGGTGLEIIYKEHKTTGVKLVPFGVGKKTSFGPGLYGGHQAGACELVIAKNTDSNDWLKRGDMPDTLEKIYQLQGEVKDYPPNVSETPSTEGDVIYLYGGGAGGYGDPIDRDPRAVLKDVADQLTSAEYAGDVYGVVFTPRVSGVVTDYKALKSLKVDMTATEKQREEIRKTRRAIAKSA